MSAARFKKVSAQWEYLDGTQGVSVRELNHEYDDQYRLVPAAMLKRHEALKEELFKLDQDIMACPLLDNPKYAPGEDAND